MYATIVIKTVYKCLLIQMKGLRDCHNYGSSSNNTP